jgi:hypothetical protein
MGSETRTTRGQKLSISAEQLDTSEVADRVAKMQSVQSVEIVKGVGAPTVQTPTTSWMKGSVTPLGLSGLLGGALGWLIAEIVASPDSEGGLFSGSLAAQTAFWTALLALGLGAVVSTWEGIQLRSWPKISSALVKAVPVCIVECLRERTINMINHPRSPFWRQVQYLADALIEVDPSEFTVALALRAGSMVPRLAYLLQ